MLGVCRSSAKTYVLGAEVACEIKSAAARGDAADLLRARKGSSALRALVCSMLAGVLFDYRSKSGEGSRGLWVSSVELQHGVVGL